jgi:hypothetical protein
VRNTNIIWETLVVIQINSEILWRFRRKYFLLCMASGLGYSFSVLFSWILFRTHECPWADDLEECGHGQDRRFRSILTSLRFFDYDHLIVSGVREHNSSVESFVSRRFRRTHSAHLFIMECYIQALRFVEVSRGSSIEWIRRFRSDSVNTWTGCVNSGQKLGSVHTSISIYEWIRWLSLFRRRQLRNR